MGEQEIQMKKKIKDCKEATQHEWRFLERWIDGAEWFYVFYCIHCLEITDLEIEQKKKGRECSS
jgi:hypothetical protein